MPPLILHNVPDDELYVGEDGVTRPYAMLFPGVDGPRARRTAPETGSFGKSTRRSRSKSNTPAPKEKERDPTLEAADKIFGAYVASHSSTISENTQRKSKLTSSVTAPNLSGANPLSPTDGNADVSKRYYHKEPTEVILRGFKETQQYAAIREYERIAGRICEDYPRDPPVEQRKYKADLRDPATLRTKPMTQAERAKALRFAGGEHWIKVTFESAEAAEIAVESSPQTILGHLISAELYRGVPPTSDEEVPVNKEQRTTRPERFARGSGSLPRSFSTPGGLTRSDFSPPGSNSSSQTLDTGTLSTATLTSLQPPATSRPQEPTDAQLYCRKIPTARRIQLLPADKALLPQQTYSQRMINKIPLMSWLSGDIIGSQLPKTEDGEFDWARASLYWRFWWWLDGIVGGRFHVRDDKEDKEE